MVSAKTKRIASKVKYGFIGLLIGILVGACGVLFVQNSIPKSEDPHVTPSIVFDRIVQKNELVSASQAYSITDKASDANRFFDLFDIPFTQNSFWYRYVGIIKAGVDLGNADFDQDGNTIIVSLDQPYIISNTPDMDKTGVLEENYNLLNPIHVKDVDAFLRECVEESESLVMGGSILEEAKSNAEDDIRNMFNAALGDAYEVAFVWREATANEAQ